MHKSSTWVGKRYPSSTGFLCSKNYSILGNDVRCKFIELIPKTLENSLIFLKSHCTNLWMLVHPQRTKQIRSYGTGFRKPEFLRNCLGLRSQHYLTLVDCQIIYTKLNRLAMIPSDFVYGMCSYSMTYEHSIICGDMLQCVNSYFLTMQKDFKTWGQKQSLLLWPKSSFLK